MVKKILIFIIIMLIPMIVIPQDKINKEKKVEPSKEKDNKADNIPDFYAGSTSSDQFTVSHINFIKYVDTSGRGEILNVEFDIKNINEEPKEFYIFVFASYDIRRKYKASFNDPLSRKEELISSTFVPFPIDPKDVNKNPEDMLNENFRYKSGESKNDKGILLKFPKDPKAGINPNTGKPYILKDNLFVRTLHMSKYRKNYYYFNQVMILIFDAKKLTDDKGNLIPAFKQTFQIKGTRK